MRPHRCSSSDNANAERRNASQQAAAKARITLVSYQLFVNVILRLPLTVAAERYSLQVHVLFHTQETKYLWPPSVSAGDGVHTLVSGWRGNC